MCVAQTQTPNSRFCLDIGYTTETHATFCVKSDLQDRKPPISTRDHTHTHTQRKNQQRITKFRINTYMFKQSSIQKKKAPKFMG